MAVWPPPPPNKVCRPLSVVSSPQQLVRWSAPNIVRPQQRAVALAITWGRGGLDKWRGGEPKYIQQWWNHLQTCLMEGEFGRGKIDGKLEKIGIFFLQNVAKNIWTKLQRSWVFEFWKFLNKQKNRKWCLWNLDFKIKFGVSKTKVCISILRLGTISVLWTSMVIFSHKFLAKIFGSLWKNMKKMYFSLPILSSSPFYPAPNLPGRWRVDDGGE